MRVPSLYRPTIDYLSTLPCNRPCAAPGLTSYRYRGSYGWVMIGARDTRDALRAAERSIAPARATIDRLEVWTDDAGYRPVQKEA